MKLRELFRRMSNEHRSARYAGIVVLLGIWLVDFLTNILGSLIHLLLPIGLIMTLFIYFAERSSTGGKR
jgi:fatty acid desaturase